MFRLEQQLSQRRQQGLYRQRLTSDSPQGVHVSIGGRDYLSFCSNDYLGLAAHPDLSSALCEAAGRWGVGAGASHLLGGHSSVHQELERAMAEFLGCQQALLFSTGYMANQAVLTAFTGRDDVILQDRLNHASLLDAGQLSRARMRRYAHADLAALERLLAAPRRGQAIVASDGVFSMDGDIAPLGGLLQLCRLHDALCYVDDAHGFGVLGQHGRGSTEHAAIDLAQADTARHLLLMCTLGKALGTFGACVAGNAEYIDSLVQQGRSYIYTTALPPALAAASLAALQILRSEDWRRERLQQLVAVFRHGCRERGISLLPSSTPVQPVLIGDNQRALAIAEHLRQHGLLVFAIRQPTVAAGSERLRVSFSAAHELADVEQLLQLLDEAVCATERVT
jgi:8-amino-7-oxononanoate synthase